MIFHGSLKEEFFVFGWGIFIYMIGYLLILELRIYQYLYYIRKTIRIMGAINNENEEIKRKIRRINKKL